MAHLSEWRGLRWSSSRSPQSRMKVCTPARLPFITTRPPSTSRWRSSAKTNSLVRTSNVVVSIYIGDTASYHHKNMLVCSFNVACGAFWEIPLTRVDLCMQQCCPWSPSLRPQPSPSPSSTSSSLSGCSGEFQCLCRWESAAPQVIMSLGKRGQRCWVPYDTKTNRTCGSFTQTHRDQNIVQLFANRKQCGGRRQVPAPPQRRVQTGRTCSSCLCKQQIYFPLSWFVF